MERSLHCLSAIAACGGSPDDGGTWCLRVPQPSPRQLNDSGDFNCAGSARPTLLRRRPGHSSLTACSDRGRRRVVDAASADPEDIAWSRRKHVVQLDARTWFHAPSSGSALTKYPQVSSDARVAEERPGGGHSRRCLRRGRDCIHRGEVAVVQRSLCWVSSAWRRHALIPGAER